MIIHPNTPPRLVKAFRRAGSYAKLEEEIKVNRKQIHDLMTKGIEPTDRTDKGRDARHRMFLPRYKRRHTEPRPRTKTEKAISRMVRSTNDAVIRHKSNM